MVPQSERLGGWAERYLVLGLSATGDRDMGVLAQVYMPKKITLFKDICPVPPETLLGVFLE